MDRRDRNSSGTQKTPGAGLPGAGKARDHQNLFGFRISLTVLLLSISVILAVYSFHTLYRPQGAATNPASDNLSSLVLSQQISREVAALKDDLQKINAIDYSRKRMEEMIRIGDQIHRLQIDITKIKEIIQSKHAEINPRIVDHMAAQSETLKKSVDRFNQILDERLAAGEQRGKPGRQSAFSVGKIEQDLQERLMAEYGNVVELSRQLQKNALDLESTLTQISMQSTNRQVDLSKMFLIAFSLITALLSFFALFYLVLVRIIERFDGLTKNEHLTASETRRDEKSKSVDYVHEITGVGRDEIAAMGESFIFFVDKIVQEKNFSDAIVNSLPGIFFMQDKQGGIARWNKNFEVVSGYSAEEMKAIHVTQLIPKEDGKRAQEAIQAVFEKGYSSVEVNLTSKARKKIPFYLAAVLISRCDMKYAAVMGIDLTERKRAEEERLAKERQHHHAQKLESIGVLAGGIAHDFNNLLMGIQGYTSLMLLDLEEHHPHYQKLKSIESQVRSGSDLTRQLLGYARSGRYEVKPTDLNDLIHLTVSLFGRTKEEIQVHEDYCNPGVRADVDRGQVEQVFLNLFVNAWQAMPGGGDLYLKTERVVLDESDSRAYEVKAGHYVKVSITDTGVGMDEKTQQKIFDPFFTTKKMGRGTGLGLASVYGIIKGHGGSISVYSEKGYGTAFKIYLPVSREDVVEESLSATETLKGQGTILVVDDEKIITDVTSEMLGSLGYKVLIAGSGLEALKIFRTERKKIDLVILDMVMPGMSGGETFDLLKSIDPDIKVILSSGYSLDDRARSILERGCKAFIQKPFDLQNVFLKIRDVMNIQTGQPLDGR